VSALNELRLLGRNRGPKGPASAEVRRDTKAAAFFLAPWMLGLLLITAGPLVASLGISFTDYNLLQPPEFNGGQNYVELLSDRRLHNTLIVTLTYVLVSVPVQLIVALSLALMLDRGMRGLTFYRSVLYLPSMLASSVAIAVLWRQMFGTSGLVNQILALVGIEGRGWISDPDTSLGTLILLNVWTFGAPLVIFLAGLRQIPTMYYEAAKIDGANVFQQLRSITIPLLTPIIFFNLILQTINAFQSFTQAFIVSGGTGAPSDSLMFFTLYLYQQAFAQFNMGYAAAVGWVLVILIAIATSINFFLSKYWVFYDD
jgi:multiple sugar transport system permease protein